MFRHHLTSRTFLRLLPISILPSVRICRAGIIKMVKLWLNFALSHKHPAAEPPGELLASLERRVSASRNTKDVIELFQRSLLGFIEEEENEEECDYVEAGVEAEDAGRCESGEHSWE